MDVCRPVALSRDDFARLADQAEHGLLLVDESARVRFVNRHLLDVLGLAHRDLLGERPCDVFASCWDERAPFAAASGGGGGATYAVQLLRSNGARSLAEIRRSAFPVTSDLMWYLLRVAPMKEGASGGSPDLVP